MNEIEEYLLMIFLEENNRLNENIFGWHKIGAYVHQEEWNHFRLQELGRTITEEFEVFVTDRAIDELRNSNNDIMTWLCRKDWALVKQKIKITVVEE